MIPVRTVIISLACFFALGVGATRAAAVQAADVADLQQQVEDAERAFARSMAARDRDAFRSFLAEDAVFFVEQKPLRGRQAVMDAWAPYFEGPDAPFSWAPELVVVLEAGTLALSSGPVFNPAGQRVATFNSIWRRDPSGAWKIVLDKGSTDCEAGATDQQD